MTSADGLFMSIAEAVGPSSKSFEEVRMEDYMKAYQLKGRAPSPVPQEPADDFTRKALNLSPLFKPQAVSYSATIATGPSLSLSTTKVRLTDPTQLPPAQEFTLPTAAGEKYYAMTCMTDYEFFSHEELRYYAYLTGHKTPPVPVKMDPFLQPTKDTETLATTGAGEEKLENISARTGYEKHSPEEFRIAFLLYSREMTSAELFQALNPSVSASALLPPPPTPTVSGPTPFSSLTPALSLPVFATTTPSAPKFTFGFK